VSAAARATSPWSAPNGPWYRSGQRKGPLQTLILELGLDAARAALGHTSPSTTEVYAELDMAQAVAVMRKLG